MLIKRKVWTIFPVVGRLFKQKIDVFAKVFFIWHCTYAGQNTVCLIISSSVTESLYHISVYRSSAWGRPIHTVYVHMWMPRFQWMARSLPTSTCITRTVNRCRYVCWNLSEYLEKLPQEAKLRFEGRISNYHLCSVYCSNGFSMSCTNIYLLKIKF